MGLRVQIKYLVMSSTFSQQFEVGYFFSREGLIIMV